MLDLSPMAGGPHEAFGTAHVPCIGAGEYFRDPCDGFTAPGDRYDGSDLWRLSGTNDFVDPEHVVSHEVSGFLDRSFLRKRERFLHL